jgi:hypothetical protein
MIEYSVRDSPTSPTKSVAITLGIVSLIDEGIEPNDTPNKFVACISKEIDYGIRTLDTKEITASFDEKKIKEENNDCLGCDYAEYFRMKT